MSTDKPLLRHAWSHNSWIHRTIVKTVYGILRPLPFGIKYGFGKRLRADQIPYRLVDEGDTVVQIGAPQDLLYAGRSRAMHFALRVGETGNLVVIEPDQENIDGWKALLAKHPKKQVTLVELGGWSEKKNLKIYINDSHPASNFIEGTNDLSDAQMKDYRVVEVPCDTVDNILAAHGIPQPKLVSITTNGSERQILEGMESAIGKGLPYISLAVAGEGYIEMMKEHDYELEWYDDRGFTFVPKADATKKS